MLLDLIGRVQAQTFVAPTLNPIAAGTGGTIKGVITNVGTFIIWIAGALALGYLIYGGILYITAGGDAEKATKGRTAVINSVIGIIIVVLALVIIGWIKSFAGSGGVIN